MKHDKIKIIILAVAAASLIPGLAFSEVIYRQINEENLFVDVKNESWQPEEFINGTIIPATYAPLGNITLDGRDIEPDWSAAVEIEVPLEFGTVKEASLKALYTQEEVFIRVRWQDETENREHHPWVWDAGQSQYTSGPQIEDSVFLSFEAGCEWFPSFLTGYMYDFDGWHWLAARSDPLGQAIDMSGTVQDQDFPHLNFTRYPSRSEDNVWNMKFAVAREETLHSSWNELGRTYYLQPFVETVYVRVDPDGYRRSPDYFRQLPPPETAPSDETMSYKQFVPLKLEGQSGEVSAKGHWEDGFWTVEFRRDRITPAKTANDTVFNRMTQFSVHVYDQEERIDQASESGRLYLQFMPEEESLDENQLLVTK
jgi:hypothetical protein